ncbi:MAG: CHAP domain-containing protein [Oscillospiraceae bacterium]|nr:CHAP domain-containing protein [Oscillospiraceae bacterium]
MASGKDILAAAAREIGYHEKPGHRTKYGEWYGLQGEPWCMEFVQWVYHQCGAGLPFKTASCGELLRWYKKNDSACIVKEPVPGCIVIFDFPNTAYSTDHTGLFVCCDGFKITTIDGNTSNQSEGNGGWVQQRSRTLGYANPTYIVPRGLTAEKEDNVERYNTMREISDACPWAAETVAKLIEHNAIRGGGVRDEQGRPADMDLSRDMLRLLVINDRAGAHGERRDDRT